MIPADAIKLDWHVCKGCNYVWTLDRLCSHCIKRKNRKKKNREKVIYKNQKERSMQIALFFPTVITAP